MKQATPRHASFSVTAAEYPKLQSACPGDFPFTFAEFKDREETGIREAAKAGYIVEPIEADIGQFLEWCAAEEVEPNGIARAHFAMLLLARRYRN